MDDNVLQQLIMDELEFEPSIDAAHIGVAVDSGVVTLTGHVKSYLEKVAAERAAQRVKGVRAVAQEIQVRIRLTRRLRTTRSRRERPVSWPGTLVCRMRPFR